MYRVTLFCVPKSDTRIAAVEMISVQRSAAGIADAGADFDQLHNGLALFSVSESGLEHLSVSFQDGRHLGRMHLQVMNLA